MTNIATDLGIPSATAEREPKGYTLKYGLAAYGLFLAILTPVLGGLSIKLQTLNDGNLDAAAGQLALVTGVGALFALVAQPLVGRLSDRTTAKMGMRKPWILVGVLGAAVCLTVIGFATNLATILIAWCLAQTFSNFAQAAETATIPDQVPVARRGVVSGIIGACTPLAILTGAVGLAMLNTDALRFTVPAVIGLVFGLLFALTLRDRVLASKAGRERLSVKEFFTSFVFNPRTYPDLGWAWLTKFMFMFGYASVGTYLTLFLGAKYGMNTAEQAQFNMYANIVMVAAMVVFSVVGGRFSDRMGKRRSFVTTGAIIAALALGIMAFSPFFGTAGLGVILFAEVLLGAGTGLFFAVDTALCTEVLPNPEDTAKDLGVLNIANALPQSLAPMLAGPIIVAVGAAGYTVWFSIGALVALVGGMLVYRIKGVA